MCQKKKKTHFQKIRFHKVNKTSQQTDNKKIFTGKERKVLFQLSGKESFFSMGKCPK